MYLIIAIVAMVLGASASHGEIWDVPLGQLTMHIIFGKLLAVIYYACAVVLGLKSLEVDRIWPWHWTSKFLYSTVVRVVVAGLLVYGIIEFTAAKQLDVGWQLISLVSISGILLYFVLFSSKFEFFEKEEKHIPVEELAEAVVFVEPWFPTEDHGAGRHDKKP
ncbi:MAG: hypothetical protein GC139_03150 [Sideroxydans sp.]|nr:hypothetical protein [Sideroxydans sp.]